MKAIRNIISKFRDFIAFAILFSVSGHLFAQGISVEKVSISTRNYDELSPSFYKNGIVFCTNRGAGSIIGYSNEDSRPYKLFFSSDISGTRWKAPVLFSNELTTTFNEGPATFNSEGTVIYFTRNNVTTGKFSNVNDSSNKLGIYSSQLIRGVWQNVQPFEFNDPHYTFATPSLSHDGQRLYFSADMPGGFGGMDIYYCPKSGSGWGNPVNAGNRINTNGDETYPFIGRNGKLYFSSDGRPGIGGKDIYYTFEINETWRDPVLADSLINSPGDDYGIIVDSTGLKGYFTSDRLSSHDLFMFSTISGEYTDCDTFTEPSYCFMLYDERNVPDDTLVLHYRWDFGNDIIKEGAEVSYCFPGPGDYKIMLDITDDITGDTVAWQVEYNVKLNPPNQLFIHSPNISVTGRKIGFDANGSLLEGSDITDYSWDFGEGFKSGISVMEQKFHKPGKYTVTAGMKNGYGHNCISKQVMILESVREIRRKKSDDQTLITLLSDNELPVDLLAAFDKSGEGLQIDGHGIADESVKWLEKFVSDISETQFHVEIQVYNRDNKLKSIQDARELSYFLKNHCNVDLYGVHAADIKDLLTEDIISAGCVYEFIISSR